MRSDAEIRKIAMINFSNLTSEEQDHFNLNLKPGSPNFRTYRSSHRGRSAAGSAEKG
jgi:hypothetical protein